MTSVGEPPGAVQAGRSAVLDEPRQPRDSKSAAILQRRRIRLSRHSVSVCKVWEAT